MVVVQKKLVRIYGLFCLLRQVVVLWRLAALNPGLAPHERDTLHEQFAQWHVKVLDKVNIYNNISIYNKIAIPTSFYSRLRFT